MKNKFFTGAAASALFLGMVVAAPTASADTLSNGLTVSCTPDSAIHSTCIVGGCPRVNGDYVVDALHLMYDGQSQQEFGFKCINGETHRVGSLNGDGSQSFGVQACRKKDEQADWCTPYAHYNWAQPAPAAQPQAPVVSNAGEPTRCSLGGYMLPSGSDCSKTPNPNPPPAPTPDVTNAIQASFGQPGLGSIDFTVTNTSNLIATCHYTATAHTLNPLVPKTTTRQFNVPANGDAVETFNGAPTFTNYSVTLSCSDASGKQKAELGHVATSVLW